MRTAANRCLRDPGSARDAATARDLLDNCDAPGATAENIEAADEWFNRPNNTLKTFMAAYLGDDE
jgi:hypothetical protein